jgi:hypothetical protein
MRIACWINKATDLHSEYDIRIAFPHQQWIDECPPLVALYVHRLSAFIFPNLWQISAICCLYQFIYKCTWSIMKKIVLSIYTMILITETKESKVKFHKMPLIQVI